MRKKAETIYGLLFRSGRAVQMVNLITLYRIVTSPLLLYLLFTGRMDLFKWLLLASFFTDAIDGHLARRYNATSILGAKLDSIGDDLTILVGITGVYMTHPEFLADQLYVIVLLIGLFLIQLTLSLFRYRKISSFHTYLAKAAAVLQGCFLLSIFFFGQVFYSLFYIAGFVTAIELLEEIILVFLLPRWEANVRGLYWVWRRKKRRLGNA